MTKYVRCTKIDTDDMSITTDKIYEVIDKNIYNFLIVNDKNQIQAYKKCWFTDTTPQEIASYLEHKNKVSGIEVNVHVDADRINEIIQATDMVNNPPHYTLFPIELKDWNFEVIKTIHDKHYAAYFKTISEYIHRAHLKNGVQDLEKAVFWLQDCISKIKNGKMEIK